MPKVLIIEDEREMARLMGWGLAQSNFETRLAYDGLEGLEALKESEPDVILTDIVMPRMDGYSLCRKLQEDGTLAKIPVVVLTAFAQRADDFKSMDIQEFLVKPFGTQQLVEVIDRVLKKHRQTQKGKTIIVPSDSGPGVQAALQQFRDLGYDAQVTALADTHDYMEKVLRAQPAVLVVDASKPGIEQLIHSLHTYVLLKDMVILFYIKETEKDKKPAGWFNRKEKENKAQEEIKKRCLDAGAAKYLESMDRESFLSVLIEYCRA